ncbi:codanin-1-like [Penaeus monodon]|uniref:codanin-1-like n=1 Tax=Penaeus monodon TaxID=6687 RepID=UPI0018A76CB5|nr:codanin-1-like [Penaeus monodon]
MGRDSPPSTSSEKVDYVEGSPDRVSNRSFIDILVQTYAELILFNMTPNIMVELYYLMQLLTIRTVVKSEDSDRQRRETCYLSTIHNCIYFSTNVLLTVVELLKLLDKATIRFLSENPRVKTFSPDLQRCLTEFLESPPPAPLLNQAPKSPIGSVSFQSDTDNRNNFPTDQAFHIFRKQRDMFYEMIRIWEENRLMSGWSYGQALGPKIKQVLNLRPDPINFAHFSRLFQSQLLTMCRGDDDQHISNEDADGLGFLTLLKKQQPEKYKRLYERLVTPSRLGGPCPTPSFPGSQEFFRDFILTASNLTFNQHLKDALISRILDLNDQEFVILEPEGGDPIDNMVREEARSVVLNLRLLAKFLGFLEFLPYQTSEHLPENVMATQISLRAKVYPPININAALRQCASSGRLVVGVTWVVEFLSLVDPVALHSQHYLTVVMTLIAIFRLLYIGRLQNSSGCTTCCAQAGRKTLSPSNSLLLKLHLGWLFDLPNFPAGLFFTDVSEADIDRNEYSQNIEVINNNYCRFCIPCLRLMLIPNASRNNSSLDGMDLADEMERLGIMDVSPSKRFTPKKGLSSALAKTPSKDMCRGLSISPTKTPSKFMTVTMLESPMTTPLKPNENENVAEQTVYLDMSDFVDQQMVTICCPFICELKHLLSEFWLGVSSKKSTNSYRKITPLSTSDKTSPAQTQKQLQLQLEDNFFHNNPSSVRKTTEFVIERVSSNVIKKIRTKIIPEQREAALEKLKSTIDEQMKNSPQAVERTRDLVQKQVMDLSQELAQHIRAQCTQVTHQECQGQVLSSLTFLMPPDMTPQALDVCRKIVSRSCQEKVIAWVQSHLTPVLFSKDLSADGDRLLRQAQKAADFQAAALQNSLNDTSLSNLDTSEASATMGTESSFTGNQSGLSLTDHPLNSPTNHPHKLCPLPKKPTNPTETLPITASEHNESLPSPSKIIMDIKEMVRITVLRNTSADSESKPSEVDVCCLLGNIRAILTGRQDVNLTVFRVLESLTVDLAVSLAICQPDVMTPKVQETFIALWQPLDKNGVIPSPCGLASPMNPRTVMLIAQSPSTSHQKASWSKLESFLTALLMNKLLTPTSLQEQCIALLRHSWPQEILTGMSSCIEAVAKEAQKNKDLCGNPTLVQLLEWVGWVCGQMEEFPDVL